MLWCKKLVQLIKNLTLEYYHQDLNNLKLQKPIAIRRHKILGNKEISRKVKCRHNLVTRNKNWVKALEN